ncbi:MAG: TonB-dependent receptor [Ferrimonas sp.]
MIKRTTLTPSVLASTLAIALGVTAPALASDTTSAMRGTIVGPNGQAVTDATIEITHQPSGTVTKVQVNENGSFFARGLRVGGPYSVAVESDAFADTRHQELYLQLGQAFLLDSQLEPLNEQIERIAVIGSNVPLATGGSNTEYGEQALAKAPALKRDLKEIARLNPYTTLNNDDAGSLSIAGMTPRSNQLIVDGIGQNDDFGLNDNGYPTQRSPISLESIEQLAVNIAPTSARYNGFKGGQLNAVTRSGTNEFEGSIFYEFSDDSLANSGTISGYGDYENEFEETTFGGRLGFPLIKDTLFFFGSYEKFQSPSQQQWVPQADGISQATIDELIQITETTYGINPGTANGNLEDNNEQMLAKIDWNINADHRINFRYQYAKSDSTRNNSSSADEVNLSSYWYTKEETINNFAAEWFAFWGNNLSTELRVAYKDALSTVTPVTPTGMGQIMVQVEGGEVYLGTEQYRHANELDNQNLEVNFLGSYLLGDHQINFGYQFNQLDTYNLFVRDSLGVWEFDSLEDFAYGNASDFSYSNAYTNNPSDAAATLDTQTHGLFLEDNWAITPDLTLVAGLRYEWLSSGETPAFNQNFFDRYGFANTSTTDGLDILLPRLGLTWQLSDNTTLRASAGRFSGGQPNVWLANSFSNDGVTNVTALNTDEYLENTDPFTIPDGVLSAMTAGDGNVNALDPNFKLPSSWRYNVAVDYLADLPLLGDNWFLSAEYLYLDQQDSALWVDLAREQVGTTAGGRVIYAPVDQLTGASTDRYDIMMTNSDDGGFSRNFSLSASKNWHSGVSFYTSYTNSNVEEGTPGTSSQATSNYQYAFVGLDRNAATLGTAAYEVEHRWVLSLGYDVELIDGYNSSFNLFWERRSGRPVTYSLGSYRDTELGDQSSFDDSDYYLPYIPTGADDPTVNYGGDLTYELFMEAAEAAGLAGYAGGYGAKGSGTQPWVSTLDFKYIQELPAFHQDHTLELYVNIDNVLNLLNDDWGVVKYQSYGTKILVDFEYDPESGQYTYFTPYGQDTLDTSTDSSVYEQASFWQASLGIRYTF